MSSAKAVVRTYCPKTFVRWNSASGRHDRLCSASDGWADGFDICIKAALDHSNIGMTHEILWQSSRVADVERQRVIVRQSLTRKVDAGLPW